MKKKNTLFISDIKNEAVLKFMFVHFTYGQFEIVSYIFNQTMTIKKKFNRIHVLVVKIMNGLINYQNNHDCRPRIYSFDTFY